MSRRAKGASPSTSLGSTLTWLPSAPTKPCDSWYRLFTMHPRIPMTPVTPRLHMSQFKTSEWVSSPGASPTVPPNHALGDTAVWRGHKEEVEMSRVWVFLIDECTWMRTGQSWPFEGSSSQNKIINRSYFRNPAFGKHADRMGYWVCSTVTPDFPLSWHNVSDRAFVTHCSALWAFFFNYF